MLANLISRTILGILSIAASAVISLLIQQYLLPFMARSPQGTPPHNLSPNNSPPDTLPSDTLPPDTLLPDTLPPDTLPPDILPPDNILPEAADIHPVSPESNPSIQPDTPSPVVEESSSAIAPDTSDADQENTSNNNLKEFLEKLDK